MSKLIKNTIGIFLLTLSGMISAEILVYEFKAPELEARFNQLSQELRCPKCQNNNIADSNAPLSVDLKDIIHEKLHEGQSDKEIVSFLTERYGDFITYRPPVKPSTWLIWFGPFVVLFIGAFVIFKFVASRKSPQLAADGNTEKLDGSSVLEQWKNELADDDSANEVKNSPEDADAGNSN